MALVRRGRLLRHSADLSTRVADLSRLRLASARCSLAVRLAGDIDGASGSSLDVEAAAVPAAALAMGMCV
eukprot:1463009-Pleurochrysis_carterae.AAC.2